MKEDFLHYIWQFQYFDKQALETDGSEVLSVIHQGYHNHHSGPDFSQARLRIGSMAWVGQVEIHIAASDWYKHGHHQDEAYENVILHVVWESDTPIYRQDGSLIPCLSLKNRVSSRLKHSYWRLLERGEQLPCQAHLPELPSIVAIAALERAMVSRLERRREEWLSLLQKYNGNWEQVAYRQLARYLGGKLNDAPFIALSEEIPWQELQRHRGDLLRIEALIFGIAGFLKGTSADEHQRLLGKEYHWLQQSQNLSSIAFGWKWGRIRQGNFPTIRLAQLAALANHRPYLFSDLWQCRSLATIKNLLQVPISPYWQNHYQFGKTRKKHHQWGIDNLIINWVVPLWYTYGSYHSESQWQERALALLQELPAESIQRLQLYKNAGFPIQLASDSQGALELHEIYCQPKRCLSCAIGVKVMSIPLLEEDR